MGPGPGQRRDGRRELEDLEVVFKALAHPTRRHVLLVLHWRGGYYVKYYAPSPVEGVRTIVAAGGVAVLAHPVTSNKYRPMDDTVIRQLVDVGLFGLELDHRDNTVEGKARLRTLAKKFGLELTGSSDYHGEGKPNRLAENTTSPEVLAKLVARGTGAAPFVG